MTSARVEAPFENSPEMIEILDPTSIVDYYPGLDGRFDIQVYPNDDGGVAFYFEEVTERQRQQRRFEAVFNNTYQFTGFLDPDGRLLEANDAALSFGGLDRDEVVGKPVWETDWCQSSDEAQETAKRAVEQARDGEMFRDEVRVRGDDREAISLFRGFLTDIALVVGAVFACLASRSPVLAAQAWSGSFFAPSRLLGADGVAVRVVREAPRVGRPPV